MKASTKYNDYVGTAAADQSDHFFLSDYLQKRGVDIERYEPIGVEFFYGEGNYFHCYFICKDNQRDTPNTAVKIRFESTDTFEEFFSIFKRFNVMVTWAKNGMGYETWSLSEDTVTIDDRT